MKMTVNRDIVLKFEVTAEVNTEETRSEKEEIETDERRVDQWGR